MARLYDSWDFLDKMDYNSDGSMKPHKRERLLARGMSLSEINQVERKRMLEVKKYDEREQDWLERFGCPFSEWDAKCQGSPVDLERRQKSSLRNGEELSSLPIDIDPDDYYEQVGNAELF
jgi:hypothetical protein